MARMLIVALRIGGHEVDLASTFRSYLAAPDPVAMRRVEAAGEQEAERITAAWQASTGGLPELWFTYHSYYKAPDLIGPRLAARFDLPFVTAEASHAGKRAAGDWASWHAVNAGVISVRGRCTSVTRTVMRGAWDVSSIQAALPCFPPLSRLPRRPRPPRRGGPGGSNSWRSL